MTLSRSGFTLSCCVFALLILGGCQTTSATPDKASISAAASAKGISSFEEGKYRTAVNALEAALQVNKDDHASRLKLAESYFKLGKNDLAYKNYQKLSSIPEYRIDALQGIGLIELQRGNLDAAQQALDIVITEDRTRWRAWNGLAQAHDRKGEWDRSAKAYELALLNTDQSAIIYNNIGVSYMAQERFAEAAESFQAAIDHDKTLEAAKTNLKLALVLQDKDEEALSGDDAHDKAKALNNAGYAAMLQGDYVKAERLFLKAIETSPSFYKIPYNNLQALQSLKQSAKTKS